jgi:hypothetical protein
VSDLLRTLSFAYRRKGDDVMPANALRMMLAFDFNWFAPADAKRLVERALGAGLLVPEGEDLLRLAFAREAVEVPVGFRPTPAVLEEPIPDVPKAAPRPAAAPFVAEAPAAPPAPPSLDVPPPMPEHEDEAQAERARRGNLLTLEVARLVARRRAGEDVKPLLAEAERALLAGKK